MSSEIDELRRRLKQLEEENRALREGKPFRRSDTVTTRIAMYKNHPVITLEGSSRPFSLGIRKASAIVEKIDDLVAFVEKYGAGLRPGEENEGS